VDESKSIVNIAGQGKHSNTIIWTHCFGSGALSKWSYNVHKKFGNNIHGT